ncbi:transmembrane protein 272-like isoform X2 [Lineus longissimus]|uniref:transmembrane protein 272-like isoform X2 n=1 Tax=Lineus longissimus TaxID=88925 RepID=UPI002B4E4BD0
MNGDLEAAPPTERTPVTEQPNSPPSYDSLYGKVKAAKRESGGHVDFFKKFMIILCGTIGCTVCIGLIMAIPISMIAMGSIYLNDCRIERFIPIYLIVGGCFGILKNISNIVQRIRNQKEEKEEENAKTNPFDGIVSCFLLAWFIAGNVWIYRVYHTVNYKDPSDPNYCDPALYLYAFWITTATYIFLAVTCCCICCAGLITMCFGD